MILYHGHIFEEYLKAQFHTLFFTGNGEGQPDFAADDFFLEAKMGRTDLIRIPITQLKRNLQRPRMYYACTFADFRLENPFTESYVINARILAELAEPFTQTKLAIRPATLTAKLQRTKEYFQRCPTPQNLGLILYPHEQDIARFFTKE